MFDAEAMYSEYTVCWHLLCCGRMLVGSFDL